MSGQARDIRQGKLAGPRLDVELSTPYFQNWFLNGNVGCNFKLSNSFYVGPWAGMRVRIAGDKKVPVDNKTYTPPFLNPEASVKLGVYL